MKKLPKWELIYLIINIVVVVFLFGFYGYRTVKYYKMEHQVSMENVQKLYEVLTNEKNIMFTGDGLIKESDSFYRYKGLNVNNYLSFSGILWRIVSIDEKGVRLVSNDALSTFNVKTTSEGSGVYTYLNNTLNNVASYQNYLIESNYYIDSFDISSVSDKTSITSYAGLLSLSEYVKAGANNSYLNNGNYYYLSNTDLDGSVYYVYSEGGIDSEDAFNAYGIRMVVTLSKDVDYASGDGSIDNPYMVGIPENTYLSSKGVGSYISINDNLYRVVEVGDDYIKLINDGYIMENGENVSLSLNDSFKYVSNLERSVDKNIFIKCNFSSGDYSSYDINTALNNYSSSYYYLPSVGSLFIGEYEGVWLNNNTGNDSTGFITKNSSRLFIEDQEESHYIRVLSCISKDTIVSGVGTKENPYVLGGE